MLNTNEEWKPVVGFEGTYESSNAWRVRRIAGGPGARAGRILKQSPDSAGRPRVNLYLRGKSKTFLVSHLVADTFLPAKGPTDQVLRHLNDNPTDNRVENLAWGTYSDNVQDSIHNGTFRRAIGIAHGRAKLTEDDVREIRRLYAMGCISQRGLARRFMVSQRTICQIVRRELWKHVD